MRYSVRPDDERAVITACGAVTPCGMGVGPLAEAVFSGRSALSTVKLDDARHVGGGVTDPGAMNLFPEETQTTALALCAAEECLRDVPDDVSQALGVYVSSGKPDMRLVERVHRGVLRSGPAAVPSDFIPRALPSAPGDAVAARFGCGGPRLAFVGACSTGLDCLAMAARAVREGRASGALAGSAEASLTPLLVAAFERMGVLASSAPEAAGAVRPFARGRAGFLIGEGAGVVLVETRASAKARGAAVLAEIAGCAVVNDAHHQINLEASGGGIAGAIRAALARAGIAPDEVDHINAHGTATRLNDLVETRGLRAALGAWADRVKVCSTKPVTGHLLSASGSVELIVTIEAMRRGVAPPTINLDEPDPACDLDYTPNVAVAHPIRHALVLNYGFGGHIGAVVLGRCYQQE
ncbi:MAG: beta-ketoacyl-[acyl-carrier-protein] synthase family protein [Verrucomicrobia bacterium]|nr:beta-ketoacyl-[acyl-carrier-protein] synthase family protein [Verrucomicrobiota bacterium]